MRSRNSTKCWAAFSGDPAALAPGAGTPAAGIGAALLALAGACSEAGAQGRFEPPDGKTLLLIGQNKESAQGYIDRIKLLPAGEVRAGVPAYRRPVEG
ncbi:MAG: hypothetical protein ACYC5N_09675 [Endomicrobiales bacterium]